MTNKQAYYLVAQILSLATKPENAAEVIEMLPKTQEDWQRCVQAGSKNLVLQSMYIALKNNNLLKHLPSDLNEFLEYTHRLNLERNVKIVQQAKAVKEIFDREDIDHVFMKGTANIFDGLYSDLGERMVYDIDILVEEGKMIKAAKALIEDGYRTQKEFNELAYPSTMHYPILLKNDCVAGVEIHRLPVQYLYLKAFSSEVVFETKKQSSTEKGFWVMSNSNKMVHNFIHSQLMHNAHYHANVSLRNLYDLLLLSQIEKPNKVFHDFNHYQQKSKTYINLMHKVFNIPQVKTPTKSFTNSFFMFRHNLTLNMSRKQGVFYHFTITSLAKYVVLPTRTLFNKNARNYVFSRLKNKHWYKQHLNAYKRKFSSRRAIG